jgi:hypothetical protein
VAPGHRSDVHTGAVAGVTLDGCDGMSSVPSAGWREVYRWCHVEPPDHHDLVDERGTY